jgi:hypothetical protein
MIVAQWDFSHLQGAGPKGDELKQDLDVFVKKLPPGVTKGPERIQNVCNNYENLSVDAAYQILNPVEFEREVEEASLKQIGILVFFRNLFSITPLIFTWFALFQAANGYAHDPRAFFRPNGEQPSSFFILWQDGFQGRSPPFAEIAAIDVGLLVGFLTFTLLVFGFETRAQGRASAISTKFNGALSKLISFVADQGAIQVQPGADPKTVAEAVNKAIQRALDASKSVTDRAQQALTDMQRQVQGVVAAMGTKINDIQQQMQGLASASTQLSDAADTLSKGVTAIEATSTKYLQAGQLVQQQIVNLNTNEAALVQRLDGVTGSVSGAAQMMNTAVQSTAALADRIRQDMGQGVQAMMGNINRSAGILNSTDQTLHDTGVQLDQVAQALGAAAKILQNTASQLQQNLIATGFAPQQRFNFWRWLLGITPRGGNQPQQQQPPRQGRRP